MGGLSWVLAVAVYLTVARRPADMATEPFRPAKRWSTSELCRHTRERHRSEQDQSDTYHLSETGLIATLAVVYGLTSSPHVQTARQSGSTPTTARKPKVGGAYSIRAQEHRPPREQGHTS